MQLLFCNPLHFVSNKHGLLPDTKQSTKKTLILIHFMLLNTKEC